MPSFIDSAGQRQQFEPKLEHYAEAFGKKLSLRQYYNQTLDTDETLHGSSFDQIMASSGLFLTPDKATGIRPPSVRDMLAENSPINMGLMRPDGTQSLTITGRVLFPATVMEIADQYLMDDTTSYMGVFDSMVAVTQPIDTPHAYQPLINTRGPRDSRAQPIAQGAEPVNMATITLSEKSYRLPTHAVGVEIADEAAQMATLDLVGIAIREQALGERIFRVDEAIKTLVDGDVDKGITGLTGVNASTYDSTLAAGTMTNKAWIKILRQNWASQTYTHAICDIDTYLAIEGRSGRPVITADDGTGRLTSIPRALNPNFPEDLPFFLLESSAMLGAGVVVLLDKSKAIRKVVYTGAAYSAVEAYVMRRTTAFRFDFSEGYFRLFDTANPSGAMGWKKILLA